MDEILNFSALGPRLRAVALRIPRNDSVADIGTDHGRLPRSLVDAGWTDVIASDAQPLPLSGARQMLAGTSVQLRLGSGLAVLRPGEVQTVSMSGMGGRRMLEILSAHPKVFGELQTLVLQPQGEAEALRRWLVDRGWSLQDEEVVEERGRFYQIMVWQVGRCERVWTEMDFRYGPFTLGNSGPVTRAWILDELRHVEENYASIQAHSPGNQDACTLHQRILELKQLLGHLH